MTDRKLNEEMARLCGVKLYRCTDAWVACAFESKPLKPNVAWDPANNWEQVHKFVIPALRRMGCNVRIYFNGTEKNTVSIEDRCTGYSIATGHVADTDPSPRFICEAALEAWEKLEATNGN